MRVALDHVGVLGDDAAAMAEQWQRLGFTVVGPADLKARDDGGAAHSLSQRSAHVMFEADYIELTSVHNPDEGHHLADLLNLPPGLRLVILRSDDIEGDHHRLKPLQPGGISEAGRAVSYGDQGEARFRWFPLPLDPFPEVLVCLVQHLTPERVFHPEVTRHANGAKGILAVEWRGAPVPAAYAQLLSPWLRDVPESPVARAELTIGVSDTAATVAALEAGGCPFRLSENGLRVPPAAASGVALRFEPVD